MLKEFNEAIKERRTYYAISKKSDVTDERIEEVIQNAVKHCPSSFNSQSSRVILLLGEQHDKLWDMTKDVLKEVVGEVNWESTAGKLNSFQAGYGTVLYFEDVSVVEGLQNQFPLYKDNFPIWAQQANGMLQFAIWTALEIEGFGASLQHYNPLIDEKVKQEWGVDSNWKLVGQMPFGKPVAPAQEKQFLPLEDRMKVFK